MQKRLLTISDISCMGKCSLTTALPILSVLGHECVPLPTALLSAHTAAFPEYELTDLTDSFGRILDHFERRQVSFDGILTGYLTTARQFDRTAELLTVYKGKIPLVVDPVLGDHGRLYAGFNEEQVKAARLLWRQADYLLPNLTEAAFLLGETPFSEGSDPDEAYLRETAEKLAQFGACVMLTGVTRGDRIGVYVYHGGNAAYFSTPRQEGIFHGTGDILAAAFFGLLAGGSSPEEAAEKAARFVGLCVEKTAGSSDRRDYGITFEPYLSTLLM